MWPKDLRFDRVLLLLLASLVALVSSTAITVLIGQYGHLVQSVIAPPPRPPERLYTREELEKAERDAEARMQESARQWKSQTPSEVFREFKMNALWGIWLPWFLIPVCIRLRTLIHVAFAIAVPVGAASIKLVTPEELLIFVVALIVGALSKELLARRKRAT